MKYNNAQDTPGPCARGPPSLTSLQCWTPLCFSLFFFFFLFGKPSLAPSLGGHVPFIRGWEILPSFSLMKPCRVLPVGSGVHLSTEHLSGAHVSFCHHLEPQVYPLDSKFSKGMNNVWFSLCPPCAKQFGF